MTSRSLARGLNAKAAQRLLCREQVRSRLLEDFNKSCSERPKVVLRVR